MTDRELLVMAAKAAGYSGVSFDDGVEACINGWWAPWNPIEDDGDALRLAVELDISLIGDFPQNIVVVAFDARRIIEKYDGDKYAATRRAIVRAAAAIGSAM